MPVTPPANEPKIHGITWIARWFERWQRRAEPPGARATRHEYEFLPAALEITESPPSPTARTLVWSVLGFLAAALLWSVLGRIDIVAVAPGKIVPSGRVKVIQALATSGVRAIYVRDGQAVMAGQVLIELDPTIANADRERVGDELTRTELELARFRGLAEYLRTGRVALGVLSPEAQAATAVVALEERALAQSVEEYRSKAGALEQSLEKERQNFAATSSIVEKYRQTLPLVTQRAQSVKELAKSHLVAQNTYLEIEEQRIAAEQDLATQEANLKGSQSAFAQLQAQRQLLTAESTRTTLATVADLEQKVGALRQERVKAVQVSSQQTLVAPVDGVVQQLKVHTVGGVVTPADPLMVIVPNEGGVEVEAMVLNQDIGWVRGQQQAAVKVEAFPFTRYGTLDAQVVDVNDDAVMNDQLGLVYAARVKLAQSRMRIDDKWIELSPGMAVTVEIKTGTRRLIEYFLSPVVKMKSESVRER